MNHFRTLRRNRGFTLIELLCAVSVAGMLSSVAYPSFQSIIHKTRRSDALVATMLVQLAEERYRSSNGAFGSLEEIGLAAQSPAKHYTLAISANSPSGYEVQATASGAQAGDTVCRVLKLTIDGANLTQSSGENANTANPAEVNRKCWSL